MSETSAHPKAQPIHAGGGADVWHARRMLVGRDGVPVAPDEGTAIIEAQAARDDADALCTLATLRAGGAWTHHSWPEALDLLQRAAELGSTDARTQLCILASDLELAARVRVGQLRDADRWARLKQSIDLDKWVTPNPPVQICEFAPRLDCREFHQSGTLRVAGRARRGPVQSGIDA